MSKITNRRVVSNVGADFYPTPAWGTLALVQSENLSGSIWEPACGNGAMAKVLQTVNDQVYASDLNNHGYGETGIDFLCSDRTFDNIITNPPFNIAEEFVQQGLRLANHKVALLLRLAFLESVSRHDNIYTRTPPSRVWVFSQRLSMYPEGSTAQGSGTTSYGWFVWDKQDTSRTTVLKWIPPGLKPKLTRKIQTQNDQADLSVSPSPDTPT